MNMNVVVKCKVDLGGILRTSYVILHQHQDLSLVKALNRFTYMTLKYNTLKCMQHKLTKTRFNKKK
jgi:hypothetical protein